MEGLQALCGQQVVGVVFFLLSLVVGSVGEVGRDGREGEEGSGESGGRVQVDCEDVGQEVNEAAVAAVAPPPSGNLLTHVGSLLCMSVRANRYGDRDAEYVRTSDTVNQGAAIGVPRTSRP